MFRRGLGGLLLVLVALFAAACSGQTTAASNITASSATLNASAKCGDNGNRQAGCSFFFEYGAGNFGSRTAVRGPTGSTGGRAVPLSDNVSGLSPGTSYEYRFCGWGDGIGSASNPICVGPDDRANTQTTFTTAQATRQQTTHCAGTDGSGAVSNAALDACGFPSPDSTGVPAGTQLTSSGGLTASTAGATYKDLRVNGSIYVTASDVTIEDSDITYDDEGGDSGAVRIGPGVTGVRVLYDTIHGSAPDAAHTMQYAVENPFSGDDANAVTVDHVDFYNGQRILHGPGTLTNSFCLNEVPVPGAHEECVYEGGGGIVIDHNTLLVHFGQTAAIFISDDFADLTSVRISNNLLAGGGYVVYADARNVRDGAVPAETISGNHFSKLYYPSSGYWGPLYGDFLPAGAVWSGNVWDDSLSPVSP